MDWADDHFVNIDIIWLRHSYKMTLAITFPTERYANGELRYPAADTIRTIDATVLPQISGNNPSQPTG